MNNFNTLTTVKLSVSNKDICYISWILDACEGLGFMQTDDAKLGKVTIFTPTLLLKDIYSMIEGLQQENILVYIDSVKDHGG